MVAHPLNLGLHQHVTKVLSLPPIVDRAAL